MSKRKLYIRVASKRQDLERGLMFVKNMDNDEGMLFVFPKQQELRFWGENTYIPLDIAFVDENKVIKQISNILPFSKNVIKSSSACKYAIEANSGYFKHMGINVGDVIDIGRDNDGNYVVFESKKRSTNLKESKTILSQYQDEMPLQYQQVANQEDPMGMIDEKTEPNVPTINKDDLYKYLEDDLEKEPLEVEPPKDEMEGMPGEPPEVEQPLVDYPQFTNAFDASEWAEQNNEVIRMQYVTKKGTSIVRDVEPHGQFHADSTGHQILVTFDETVGDIRAFIMQNIRGFSFLGQKFEPKFKLS